MENQGRGAVGVESHSPAGSGVGLYQGGGSDSQVMRGTNNVRSLGFKEWGNFLIGFLQEKEEEKVEPENKHLPRKSLLLNKCVKCPGWSDRERLEQNLPPKKGGWGAVEGK